ncbi:MAG: bifunctional phosphoribosylaminoimidazolecarboxamide formyltransferase/IMP cyclohydrolase [Candidatus Omnitrophota bacterium]|nr:bifunctional phosphoribosylaminoimidazolecarboxamide formyltransferase/IMP cyclohydrolase [Candidatus Omnitrophota bacterium]
MIKVKRALLSVSDKTGLVAFAKGLHAFGIEILSTGGTAKQLKDAGIPVMEVSEYTGFPEMMDGRVKTLHPKIHAGILALRENPEHQEQIKKHKMGLIDMVVVNLYPFERATQKKNVSWEEAIDNIDIGGPAMLRSAAKNYKSVAVVCNPKRYQDILRELNVNSGILPDSILFPLFLEAFEHTAHYDKVIHEFFSRGKHSEDFSALPKDVTLKFSKIQDLRYGENPHQAGALYADAHASSGFAKIKQRSGKELSFNNILDLNAAIGLIRELEGPAATIVKHGNPAGIAQSTSLAKAFSWAWQCDPESAFGGIIGLNRTVDLATATAISKSGFMECIIAPSFSDEAFALLSQKKNLRLVELNFNDIIPEPLDFKKIYGGVLLQQADTKELDPNDLKIVTQKKPTSKQLAALLFGWKIIKHIKSNAIILMKDTRTVGIGCGQTSRVESVRVALQKAGKNARQAVLASDAFLPKTDNVKLAAKAGISAIIQPGGSIADEDVIREADKANLAMVFTGIRHFKH